MNLYNPIPFLFGIVDQGDRGRFVDKNEILHSISCTVEIVPG